MYTQSHLTIETWPIWLWAIIPNVRSLLRRAFISVCTPLFVRLSLRALSLLGSLAAAGWIASLLVLPTPAVEAATPHFTVIARGLDNPRGIAFGPEGAGTPHDCAYQVIYMASGQPGADPIAVHHCFEPTSFMGSKSDEEFQTAFRPLIPSQPRQFEYVGSLPETRPDGTQGKIEIYVVRDPYPASVYAFHIDQDGLIANVGAN
jgi:hypothetical protein